MSHVCQVCGDNIDQYGNRAEVVDPLAKTMAGTCLKCRLEALRAKLHGPKKKHETNLPYKDL